MKWMAIIVFMLLATACSSGADEASERVLFAKVITASKMNNAANLLDDDYDRISEYISQGQSRWIRIYPLLNQPPFLAVTYFQEGLNIAMARALPENPAEVLKLVNEENVALICGAPFIEPTAGEIKDYLATAGAALNKLQREGYWKQRCILNLRRVSVAS